MPEGSRKNLMVIQQVTERHLSTSITSITLPSIALSPSSLVRPITSSASTVRCGNGSHGWYARHYRSQRILPTISGPSSISFVTTTSPKGQHYQNSTTEFYGRCVRGDPESRPPWSALRDRYANVPKVIGW